MAPVSGQLVKNSDEPIHLGRCVVNGQRSANGRLKTKTAKNRLGTVVAGANCDALLVERGTHLFRLVAGKQERQHAGFRRSSANDAEAWNGQHLARCVLE